jgi:hypothetical protein
MADQSAKDDRTEDPVSPQSDATQTDDDTEGHLMMPNIAAARGLANERVGSAERNARLRIRQRDERPGEKRSR